MTLLLAGCTRRPPPVVDPTVPTRRLPPPTAISESFVLESWGVPPEDTTIAYPAQQPRVVLLRRGAPDNNIFLTLTIPAGVIVPPDGESLARLTLLPRPGVFGVDILLAPGSRMRPGAEITFSYAIHFVMPAGSRERYGSPLAFERELLVAQETGNGVLNFLPSRRPSSDNLTAMLTGPGRYLVAAPR